MLYTRYARASALAEGRDVLEVACGPGHGLGLLTRQARRVVAGDYTEEFVRFANAHYRGRVPVVRLDAEALPFCDASFDLVLLFEAIYYLRDASGFLRETSRILRPGGTLVICSANCEWIGFNKSPFSTKYWSAEDLRTILQRHDFEPEIFGAFPVTASTSTKLINFLRYFASSLHLFPRTMAGKEFLKRIFYGNLHQLGPELTPELTAEAPLHRIPPNPAASFKVLYAFGHLRPQDADRAAIAP